jgi:UbiD family decarboxylase
MAKDLRHFLNEIKGEHPDLLLRITEEVNPSQFDITALLSLLEKKGHEKMALFEKALSIDGKTHIPLLFNVFFSRSLYALALGLSTENQQLELLEEFAKRENSQGHLELVEESEAPCKEAVWEGEAASLLKLPVPMHHEKDIGPYLTMICIMKGAGQDFYDITFTKNRVKGPKRMSVSAHPHHHLEAMLAEYEMKKMKAPIIVVLGHHPVKHC